MPFTIYSMRQAIEEKFILILDVLENFKPSLVNTTSITLKRGETAVKPKNYGGTSVAETANKEPSSKIIEDLNQQFSTTFTEEDRVLIEQKVSQDQQLAAGSKQAVRMSFEEVAQNLLHELIESNFKFYKKVQDDEKISKELFDRLFERYYRNKKS